MNLRCVIATKKVTKRMLWASLCYAKKNLERTTLPRADPTHGPQFFQANPYRMLFIVLSD
jgi:hypothetical protein